MSKSGPVEALRSGIGYASIGFGALGLAAPRAFAAVYGLKGDGNLRAIIRMWGTRNIVLGTLMVTAEDPGQQWVLAAASTGLSVTDTLVAATAGEDVATRARVMGVLTTAGFAAAAGYVLANS